MAEGAVGALMSAATAVIGICLGIDALAVAIGLLVDAGAFSFLADLAIGAFDAAATAIELVVLGIDADAIA